MEIPQNSNQIKHVYDYITSVLSKYKQSLDKTLEHDEIFEDKCEYEKHNLKLELLDDICLDLENIREEFFRGI